MKITRDELVAGGVAVASFACSAAHIYTVAVDSGNPWFIAALHPVGLDGLIFVGLRNLKRAPAAAWTAAGYGAIMSLAFNGASYAHAAMPWWLMAATMPLAMVLGFVVLHASHRDTPTDVPVARVPSPRRVPSPVSQDKPADVPAVSPGHVPTRTVPAVVSRVPRLDTDDGKRDKALRLLAEGRDKRDVAATVGVSVRTLNRWIKPAATQEGDQ